MTDPICLYNFLRFIRSISPDAEVLVETADATEEEEGLYRRYAQYYILKPNILPKGPFSTPAPSHLFSITGKVCFDVESVTGMTYRLPVEVVTVDNRSLQVRIGSPRALHVQTTNSPSGTESSGTNTLRSDKSKFEVIVDVDKCQFGARFDEPDPACVSQRYCTVDVQSLIKEWLHSASIFLQKSIHYPICKSPPLIPPSQSYVTKDNPREFLSAVLALTCGETECVGRAELRASQHEIWYRALSPLCPRTMFVTMPTTFILWLESDDGVKDQDSGSASGNECSGSDTEDDFVPPQNRSCDKRLLFKCSEQDEQTVIFVSEVKEALRILNRPVVPKLNWKSPTDAIWMLGGMSPGCRTFNDICLLLKSSNFNGQPIQASQFITRHSLQPDNDHGLEERSVLGLQEELDTNSAIELRMFTSCEEVLAVCRRPGCGGQDLQDLLSVEEVIHKKLKRLAIEVYDSLSTSSDDCAKLARNLAVDVILMFDWETADCTCSWVIGISPWPVGWSDPCLFTWQELVHLKYCSRELDASPIIRMSASQPPSRIKIPQDFIEMASASVEEREAFIASLELNEKEIFERYL